jgi:ubiquinone/menaquinone biosynthesis C-methylase UbiE
MADTARHTHSHANMFGLARHATGYDRLARFLARPLYRRVAADVAAGGLAAGSLVLDVGTGPGRVPMMIANACPDIAVDGIDLSAEMIARANSTAQSSGARRVRFQVADVAALPYPDRSVDLVVSTISLHHWDNPAAGLTEIVRVLRADGQAWIYDFRWALRSTHQITDDLDANSTVEHSPLWLNPIARLVLHPGPVQAR